MHKVQDVPNWYDFVIKDEEILYRNVYGIYTHNHSINFKRYDQEQYYNFSQGAVLPVYRDISYIEYGDDVYETFEPWGESKFVYFQFNDYPRPLRRLTCRERVYFPGEDVFLDERTRHVIYFDRGVVKRKICGGFGEKFFEMPFARKRKAVDQGRGSVEEILDQENTLMVEYGE